MLPRLCQDLPAITGVARSDPQQTRLEELLVREPSGSGDHFWIRLRKTGCSTTQAVQAVARAADVEPKQVRFIASRDRQAVVEQWFSLPVELVEAPKSLNNAGYKRMIQVLQVVPADRPISPGLLRGLRYRLQIADGARDDGLLRAKAILDRLRTQGVPNYHPAGFGGNFVKWGRMMLQGRRLPERVRRQRLDKPRCLQAVQAWLFNAMVAARLEDGLFDQVLPGELLRTSCQLPPADRGEELVAADDCERAGRRCASWEAVQLMPLFGEGMNPAGDEAAARETAQLAALSLGDARLDMLRGGRRALRFQPQRASIELDGQDLFLNCELDEEAYASVLLEELLQGEGHLH